MPFTTTRRVEFRDTDAAGIVHFSVFFTYMEQAEHELLRSLGTSVMQADAAMPGETIGWPRVSAGCDFHGPARFEQTLQIEVFVEHIGTKSVRYRHEFSNQDGPVATGHVTAVCCRFSKDRPMESIAIANPLRKLLEQFTSDSPRVVG